MGCSESAAFGFQRPARLSSGPAAKHYFYLDDLPCSIYASAEGPSGLRLRVVGADICGISALRSLEVAFRKRAFVATLAQIHGAAGLVDMSFDLTFLSPASRGNWPPKALVGQGAGEPGAEQVSCRLVPTNALPEGKGLVANAEMLVHVVIRGQHTVGLRAAALEAVRSSKHRVVYAALRTTILGATVHDELWLQRSGDGHEEPECQQLRSAILVAMHTAGNKDADVLSSRLAMLQTPPKCYQSKTTAGLINAIEDADARLLRNGKGELRGLPDLRENPCTAGFQISGYAKYTGARLTHRAGKAEDSTPILQIRTLFVRLGGNLLPWGPSRLQALLTDAKAYAEFVSWLDVPSSSWTIYKVFLNQVLAAGKQTGAHAIAEHLSGSPEMFLAEQGRGTERFGSPMSGPVASIGSLQTIHVCDVVNWNTYMLMAIAASEPRSADLFGDHFGTVLVEELQASKLSRTSLLTSSAAGIFKHTALGKLVRNVIAIWNKQLGLHLEICEVEVAFEDTYERLEGEMRKVMDLLVRIGPAAGLGDLPGDAKFDRQFSPDAHAQLSAGPLVGAPTVPKA